MGSSSQYGVILHLVRWYVGTSTPQQREDSPANHPSIYFWNGNPRSPPPRDEIQRIFITFGKHEKESNAALTLFGGGGYMSDGLMNVSGYY